MPSFPAGRIDGGDGSEQHAAATSRLRAQRSARVEEEEDGVPGKVFIVYLKCLMFKKAIYIPNAMSTGTVDQSIISLRIGRYGRYGSSIFLRDKCKIR